MRLLIHICAQIIEARDLFHIVVIDNIIFIN